MKIKLYAVRGTGPFKHHVAISQDFEVTMLRPVQADRWNDTTKQFEMVEGKFDYQPNWWAKGTDSVCARGLRRMLGVNLAPGEYVELDIQSNV